MRAPISPTLARGGTRISPVIVGGVGGSGGRGRRAATAAVGVEATVAPVAEHNDAPAIAFKAPGPEAVDDAGGDPADSLGSLPSLPHSGHAGRAVAIPAAPVSYSRQAVGLDATGGERRRPEAEVDAAAARSTPRPGLSAPRDVHVEDAEMRVPCRAPRPASARDEEERCRHGLRSGGQARRPSA